MKFIEIVDGFSINIDEVVSVKRVDDTTLLIETENREYQVQGNFQLFMDFLQQDDRRKRQQEKMTTQFFGG